MAARAELTAIAPRIILILMCARYTLRSSAQAIRDLFHVEEPGGWIERYNIAPTQEVAAITQSREGEKRLRMLRWGLVPVWAKSLSVGVQMINAKAESLQERAAFRNALERRRCLIPSDGFYEWKDVDDDPQGTLFDTPKPKGKTRKQPYHITLKSKGTFAFAGLWERWSDADGYLVDTCTIITTTPNDLVAPIHDRMPVILGPEDYEPWLDRHERDIHKLSSMLLPYSAEEMVATAVNPIVGNPKNDSAECIAPFKP